MRRRRELIALLALASAACSGDSFVSAALDGGATDGAASDGAAAAADGASAADGGVPADAGADARVPQISCGTSTCKLVDSCCVYTNMSGAQYACHEVCAPPQNGDQLSTLKCSGAADCLAGQVCCIQRTGSQNASSCSATPCSGNQVQLCDPTAQDSGCPVNAPCSSNNISDWKLPSTFATCGGQAVP